MPSNISDATGYGASTQFDAGVPILSDSANIVDAFKYYHYGPNFDGTNNLGGIESHLRLISASVIDLGSELSSVSSSVQNVSASVENQIAYQSDEPSSPFAGQIWIDSDNNKTYVYTGSTWILVSGSGGGDFHPFLMGV